MGIASIFDVVMSSINKATRGDLSGYSILESGHGKILLGSDGSAATVIRFNGSVSVGGEGDMAQISRTAAVNLGSFFSKPGHAMQVYFYRDPDRSKDLIRQATQPSRNIANGLRMSLDDVFEEEVEHLSKYISDEEIYFVLWTRPGVLPKSDRKQLDEARQPPEWWPKARDTQALNTVSERILAIHRSFVQSFLTQMRSMKMSVEALDVSDAVREIRDSLYNGAGHPGWSPYMPGTVGKRADGTPNLPPPRMPAEQTDASSNAFWSGS